MPVSSLPARMRRGVPAALPVGRLSSKGKYAQPKETHIDWNRVQGSWKQLEGKVKAKWGKLTADDLTAINGRREELEGKIQQRYGIAKDQARKEIDDWLTSQGV